jgi:hypothetical protein
MKPVAHIGLQAAARAYTPLIALFAALLLATYPAGSGVGLFAGLVFSALHALHMIVYGAAASRRALPSIVSRGLVAVGLFLCLGAIGAAAWPYAARMGEAGLFLVTASGSALLMNVLVGRAPSLRDEDW